MDLSSKLVTDQVSIIPDLQANIFNELFTKVKLPYIILLCVIIFIFVFIFSLFGTENPVSSGILSIIELVVFISLVYILAVNYNRREYDFTTIINNLFNSDAVKLDVKIKSKQKKEVFHLPDNVYTYNEAQKACKTYDSRLAKYEEIENAYNNGATWCSYGWSDNKQVLFPTQKEVYDTLQKVPGHENDCGRQGVNGGYIINPNVKYGANCYGTKPEQSNEDKTYMKRSELMYSPLVDKDILDELEKNKESYLVAPFNKNKWSMN